MSVCFCHPWHKNRCQQKPSINSCKPLQEHCCFPLDGSTSTITQKLLIIKEKKGWEGIHPKPSLLLCSKSLPKPPKFFTLVVKSTPGSSPLTQGLSLAQEGMTGFPSRDTGKKSGAFSGPEANHQKPICFQKQKQCKACSYKLHLTGENHPGFFLLCVFLWAGITAGMCGGWCRALLKLALPHLGCVFPCSCTHKRGWKTLAAVTWRKHQAQSANHLPNQFVQAAQMLSSSNSAGNSKAHNEKGALWKKKKN